MTHGSQLKIDYPTTFGFKIDRINTNKDAHYVVDVVKYSHEYYVKKTLVLHSFIEVEFARFLQVNTRKIMFLTSDTDLV